MQGKLYYDDPYLREFTATVMERGIEENGMHYVVLDQTAFYPTGGGQPCDQGIINGVEILEVEEVDGKIHHRSVTPVIGESVNGSIHWERRLDHMQQHTGQHILSASFEQLFNAATVGFHLGRETVTIDLNINELTEEMILAVTESANLIVFENRAVEARFVNERELGEMPLRKPPTVQENIRIVIVEEFDYSPCGGTHPIRTGEVGPIQILGYERSRSGVRVEFVCGMRSVRSFVNKQYILRSLGQLLSSSETELVPQLERALAEKREQEKVISDYKEQFLDMEAAGMVREADLQIAGYQVVAQTFADRPMQELQRLAKKMTAENPRVITVLISHGSKLQIICARGKEAPIPMDEWIKFLLPLIQGKGGGNREMAQGGGASVISAEFLLQTALDRLQTYA